MGRNCGRGIFLILLALSSLIAAGCGGSAEASEGPVVLGFTVGRDPMGLSEQIIADCNERADGAWEVEPVYMPPSVDGQREQLIRRLAGKDPAIDILTIDVVWTAEFSEAGWLYDLTERIRPLEQTFVPAALETVRWQDKYWAVPAGTNVAVLYYRTDLVKTPPKTWEELVATAKKVTAKHPDMVGFLWQASQYEGLTVDAMEFILGADGSVLSADGTESLVTDNDGAKHAFTFMRSTVESGITPKQVLTFQEEESRQMFQQGKAVFLRNWPYVYSLANGPDSKVRGKFAAVPLPGFEGRQQVGVLGGMNLAVSRYSDAPEEAWAAIECLASEEMTIRRMRVKGELSAHEAAYTDPRVLKDIPFTKVAREALDVAKTRPATPYYNDVTYAIAKTANDVTAGRISPEDAAKRLDEALQKAIDGKGEI